jgi:probable HAF family extracellular repeat protein
MAWPAGYTLLPGLPSGTATYAYGISGDGLVVVGEAYDSGDNEHAAYWTIDTGPVDLGFLPGGSYSLAQGTNSDGSVIVGYGDATDGNEHAFIWTAAGGMVDLGLPSGSDHSYALGVSADGTVVVGYANPAPQNSDQAFRWTQAGGFVFLPSLDVPDPTIDCGAFAISADGAVIAGNGNTVGSGIHAVRWPDAVTIADLDSGGAHSNSLAYAASADGSVVIGSGSYAGANHAFRWTAGDGLADLGTLPSGTFSNGAGVTDDGTIVVGYGDDSTGQQRAWQWTAGDGMVALPDLAGVGPTAAYNASWIAGNGSAIVGYARVAQTDLPYTGQTAVYWTLADGLVHFLDLPADTTGTTTAYRVSDDGSIIAGYVSDGASFQPAYWTSGAITLLSAQTGQFFCYDVSGDGSTFMGNAAAFWKGAGYTVLPILPGDDAGTGARYQEPNFFNSGSRLCSTDGTKIIGNSVHNNFPATSTATGVVWTNGVITTSLPNSNPGGGVFLDSCSADGISVIAGSTFDGVTHLPCIWLGGTVQHNLVGVDLQAVSCSEDGAVICLEGGVYVDSLSTTSGTPTKYGVGHSRGYPPGGYDGASVYGAAAINNLLACGAASIGSGSVSATKWNGTAPTLLATLAGWTASTALAMSGDGAEIVGFATTATNQEAIHWDGAGVAHQLENPFPGYNAAALYISRDGTIAVGYVSPPSPLPTAWVYGLAVTAAAITDLWFGATSGFVDLRGESERRKFIGLAGSTQYLGANGERPFGAAPPVFLTRTGAANAFADNLGAGGAFVITGGDLTDDGAAPPSGAYDIPVTVDPNTPQGADPQVMLSVSDDGGRTFSLLQKWRSLGKLGEYTKRLRWLKMGSFRQRQVRLEITDPVRRNIVGVYTDVTPGLEGTE